MNKIFLSGNLTRDPEIRYTQSGKAMAKLGIAVNRGYRSKNSDSDQPTVDFFNLTAWDKTAEFCERYLTKGTRVVVEGRLFTSTYADKDGNQRKGYDVNVDNIEFASNKNSGDGDYPSRTEYEKNPNKKFDDDFGGEEISDDDVPF